MPEITVTDLGIWAVAAMLISKWLMDWLRHRREEANQFERKSSPSIDEKIARSEAHCLQAIAKVAAENAEENKHLHKRISDLRNDVTTAVEKSQDKQINRIEQLMDKMSRWIEETAKSLGELKAGVTTLAQQQHSTSQQLQRHIESQKHKP